LKNSGCIWWYKNLVALESYKLTPEYLHYQVSYYEREGKGPLDNGYFDNLDDEFSNKYEKILNIEKKSL
jgi:hypothetical protein